MTTRPDMFFWYELMTTDVDAAKHFYRAVVGWNMQDTGDAGVRYTVLSAGDRGIGGMLALSTDACAAGARPGWLGFAGVPDTDAAAKRIAEAGGAIHRGPEDIPTVGRFAVVADPGGAVFMLLTPFPRDDAPPPPEPGALGTVRWHELCAGNGQAAAFEFYAKQFGWQTLELMDMGAMGQYRIFGTDGVARGAMMDKPKEVPAPYWAFYFNVDGIDAAVERIRAHGGTVLMGPHEVPGGSWIVQASDPQGAWFAVVAERR